MDTIISPDYEPFGLLIYGKYRAISMYVSSARAESFSLETVGFMRLVGFRG
jgi:hypothetical protein